MLSMKLFIGRKGVGGGNSTDDRQDNKTCLREGPLLCSSFMKEVRVNECRTG